MTKSRISLGQRGEQLARARLQQQGYIILEANWRCTFGELDIIAQQHEMIVFVEVRTRYADSAEPSLESITLRKQKKLANLAQLYLEAHELEDALWRIDVVAIAIMPDGKPLIQHVENALGW